MPCPWHKSRFEGAAAAAPAAPSRWPLLGLVLLVGLCLGLVGWKVYALWSKTVNSAGNNLLVGPSSSKLITIRGQMPEQSALPVSQEPEPLAHIQPERVDPDLPETEKPDYSEEACAPAEERPPAPSKVSGNGPKAAESLKVEELPPLPNPAQAEVKPPPALESVTELSLPPPPIIKDRTALVGSAILVYLLQPVRPLGDTPMMCNWKMVGLATVVLASTVVNGPAVAQPAPEKTADAKTILDRLEKMDKALVDMGQKIGQDMQALKNANTELKTDLTPLKEEILKQRLKLDLANSKIEQLEIQLTKVAKDLEDVKKRLPSEGISLYPPGEKNPFDEIKTKLGQIEQMLGKIQQPAPRVSLSPPSLGRIILVNLYNEDLLFMVNQRPYRVAPNTTMTLENQTAGELSYEVISDTWGVRARNTTTLSANETFTLTAR